VAGALLPNIVVFGRTLRRLGFPVTSSLVIDFTKSLNLVSIRRREDVYFAARSLFVQRREDFARFDGAFDAFWRARAGREALDLRALMEASALPPEGAASRAAPTTAKNGGRERQTDPAEAGDTGGEAFGRGFSAQERLRRKDFSELNADELAAVQALIRRSARIAWRRRSRRLTAGRGPELDLRRTLRSSFRHGGEWLDLSLRRRLNKTRPLVVLADISGSMARYTRLLLMAAYALARGYGAPFEAFVFGTQLTRITRPLMSLPVDQALERVARQVQDWSGGTRIGDALHTFNLTWTRRVLSSGAVVLLISDGWDRGDPESLAQEMARLQRRAHRLIWLNPLLGTPGYRPLTQGVQAALPYVDDFWPAHNLASLDDLASHLSALIRRGPAGLPSTLPTWNAEGG
jgi:uncharacterized protein with von Willebrand factor type A (vWA) domain